MTTYLAKTKAQLEVLGFPFIGIQLKDGSKLFGVVTKFTQQKIYFRDKNGDELDVPRRIISRALLLIKGDEEDDRPAAVCTAY
jgi:hypothetical protein